MPKFVRKLSSQTKSHTMWIGSYYFLGSSDNKSNDETIFFSFISSKTLRNFSISRNYEEMENRHSTNKTVSFVWSLTFSRKEDIKEILAHVHSLSLFF